MGSLIASGSLPELSSSMKITQISFKSFHSGEPLATEADK